MYYYGWIDLLLRVTKYNNRDKYSVLGFKNNSGFHFTSRTNDVRLIHIKNHNNKEYELKDAG